MGHDNVAVTASIGIAQTTASAGGPMPVLQSGSNSCRTRTTGATAIGSTIPIFDQQVHTRVLLARESWVGIDAASWSFSISRRSVPGQGVCRPRDARSLENRPQHSIREPSVFIPIAERTGDNHHRSNGCWTRRAASCGNGRIKPEYTIDVSGGQFKASANIVADLKGCLERHGIDACRGMEASQCGVAAALRFSTLEACAAWASASPSTNSATGIQQLTSCLANAPLQRFKAPRFHSSPPAALRQGRKRARAVRASVRARCELGLRGRSPTASRRRGAMLLLAAGCEQGQGPFFAPVLSAAEATVCLRVRGVRPKSTTTQAGVGGLMWPERPTTVPAWRAAPLAAASALDHKRLRVDPTRFTSAIRVPWTGHRRCARP